MISKIKKIIITTGDPAGVGLDLCIKLAYKKFPANITVIGNLNALKNRAKFYKKKITAKKNLSTHEGNGNLNFVNIPYEKDVVPGEIESKNSITQLSALTFATEECLKNNFDALVTLPINKKALSSSDINFTGHTEFISKICNTLGEEIMLLTNKNLKVALVTTHLALKMVPKSITKKILEKKLQVLNEQLINKFNIKNPRISVTGLNPHAGEDGEFGDEEIKIITPVLKKLKAEGINLIGPIPADTAFTKKYLDKTDCFLAMYHDQGLSAFKALSFGKGINVTIGIPIIRTSVDHGTGLDIVESDKINASSFFESISLAIKLIKK